MAAAVISNVETNEKLGYFAPDNNPDVSFLDPTNHCWHYSSATGKDSMLAVRLVPEAHLNPCQELIIPFFIDQEAVSDVDGKSFSLLERKFLMFILGFFLLQAVDLVDISILYNCQKHTIFIVIILDLNKDMALVTRCERG